MTPIEEPARETHTGYAHRHAFHTGSLVNAHDTLTDTLRTRATLYTVRYTRSKHDTIYAFTAQVADFLKQITLNSRMNTHVQR